MAHAGPSQTPTGLDVLALGSVMVEITPTEAGIPLSEVRELAALPGGAACNFSAALARLGAGVSLATGVGSDEWGAWLKKQLVELGIDVSRVKAVAGQLTTVSFCWVDREGGKRFYFYRVPGHSDPITALTIEDIGGDDFGGAAVFDFSEAAIRKQPLRDVALDAARKAREAGKQVCYAVNYRPASWDAPHEEVIATQRAAIGLADIVVMNQDEALLISAESDLDEAVVHAPAEAPGNDEDPDGVGPGDPTYGRQVCEAVQAIASLGPQVVAVTGGEEGTLLAAEGEVTHVPARQVEVLYDVGAGDVFHAGLLAGLIFGMAPEAAARFGSDAAALWISRPADLSQLPTRQEVEALPPLR